MSAQIDKHLTNYLRLQKTVVKDEVDDGYEPDGSDSQRNSQYFQWSPDSTKLLLKLRFDPERQYQFENRTQQRKDLWEDIANEMFKLGGYQLSADVCDLKYRNLLQTFKKNRIKEMNGLNPCNISWCYYDTFRKAIDYEGGNSETEPTVHLNEYNIDTNANDTNIYHPPNKRQKTKSDMNTKSPLVPIAELRAPSKRLSNKRQMNAASNLHSFSSALDEPESKIKISPPVDNVSEKSSISKVTSSSPISHSLTSFEMDECRSFGETVGVQLSLIKSPDTRALAELKIQEILYAAKISKLKG